MVSAAIVYVPAASSNKGTSAESGDLFGGATQPLPAGADAPVPDTAIAARYPALHWQAGTTMLRTRVLFGDEDDDDGAVDAGAFAAADGSRPTGAEASSPTNADATTTAAYSMQDASAGGHACHAMDQAFPTAPLTEWAAARIGDAVDAEAHHGSLEPAALGPKWRRVRSASPPRPPRGDDRAVAAAPPAPHQYQQQQQEERRRYIVIYQRPLFNPIHFQALRALRHDGRHHNHPAFEFIDFDWLFGFRDGLTESTCYATLPHLIFTARCLLAPLGIATPSVQTGRPRGLLWRTYASSATSSRDTPPPPPQSAADDSYNGFADGTAFEGAGQLVMTEEFTAVGMLKSGAADEPGSWTSVPTAGHATAASIAPRLRRALDDVVPTDDGPAAPSSSSPVATIQEAAGRDARAMHFLWRAVAEDGALASTLVTAHERLIAPRLGGPLANVDVTCVNRFAELAAIAPSPTPCATPEASFTSEPDAMHRDGVESAVDEA